LRQASLGLVAKILHALGRFEIRVGASREIIDGLAEVVTPERRVNLFTLPFGEHPLSSREFGRK